MAPKVWALFSQEYAMLFLLSTEEAAQEHSRNNPDVIYFFDPEPEGG